MKICNKLTSILDEAEGLFILPKDIEDSDGEIIPKGTKVKVKKITKFGDIIDITFISPDGLSSVISMPKEDAKKLGISI